VSTRLGVVGHGRFGAALAGLAQDAGLTVKAFDPGAAVPEGRSTGSLEELASSSELIAVAVPLDQMRATFEALRPLVGPRQLVFDVGSVKVLPALAMEEVFGTEIPWVATHPLFGPMSLSRGDRLRVVVCPHPHQGAAVLRVRALFASLSCEVFEQTAEEHDRELAFTQALTFFVAKGMLDIGVPVGSPRAPPSFQGMSRTIESVQADAAHLFFTLQRMNPYATEARAKLLEALSGVHRALEGPPTLSTGGSGAAVQMPELAGAPTEGHGAKETLDPLDDELLTLLARSAERRKRSEPRHDRAEKAARRRRAAELGLDLEAIDEVFERLGRMSRR
jgi:prephenate dehydrogenase